jgi:hypothetical protein
MRSVTYSMGVSLDGVVDRGARSCRPASAERGASSMV